MRGRSHQSCTIADFCKARRHESAIKEVRTNKGAEFLGERAPSGSIKICQSIMKVAHLHLFIFFLKASHIEEDKKCPHEPRNSLTLLYSRTKELHFHSTSFTMLPQPRNKGVSLKLQLHPAYVPAGGLTYRSLSDFFPVHKYSKRKKKSNHVRLELQTHLNIQPQTAFKGMKTDTNWPKWKHLSD